MKSDKEFLVRGSLINAVGLLARVVSPFLVILLARFYPQREIGLYVSFQALVLTFSRLAILGLDRGLLWHIPRTAKENSAPRGAGSGLADSLLACSLACIAAFVLFWSAASAGLLSRFRSLDGMSLRFMLLMIAAMWPMTVVQLFCGALDGKRRPQYRVLIGLFLTNSLVPLIALGLRKFIPGESSLAAGMLTGNILGCLLFIPVLRAHFPGEPWRRPSWPSRVLMRYSLPLAGSELATGLLLRVDLWMILLLLGPAKAAVYAVMVTIANGMRSVRQSFDPLIVPIVSGLDGEGLRQGLKPVFSYATNMVSTLQLFIACFIMIFPREILSLAGKAYAIEVFAFAFLLMGNLLNGFLGLNGQVILGLGKGRLVLFTTVTALVINLLCDWILIPRIGIAGAALAACLSVLYQNFLQFLYLRFAMGLDLYERHLYVNAAIEASFLAGFFLAYRRVEALALGPRIGLFAAMVLVLGGLVLAKRKTFVLR